MPNAFPAQAPDGQGSGADLRKRLESAPAPATPSADAPAAGGARAERAATPPATRESARSFAAPQAGVVREGSVAAEAPRTPEQWIERIRTLRRDGREQDAVQALREFRAAFVDADARLPEELRTWASGVPR